MRGKASIVLAVGCCKFLLAARSEVNILILAGVHPSPPPLPLPPKYNDDDNWGGGQRRFSKVKSRDLWEIKTYRLKGSVVFRINPLNPYKTYFPYCFSYICYGSCLTVKLTVSFFLMTYKFD